MANPHKSTIDAYLKELTALVSQQFDITKRISRLQQVIGGMVDLLDSEAEQIAYMDKLFDVTSPLSLTSAIEKILESEKKPMTPMQVRERVEDHLLLHTNPMASIHTVLKRLVKTGWVEPAVKDGSTYYRHVGLSEQHARDGAQSLQRSRYRSRFQPRFKSRFNK